MSNLDRKGASPGRIRNLRGLTVIGQAGIVQGVVGVAEGLSVKQAPALSWPDVADGEAVLIQRCLEGDAEACAALVSEHQRMVFLLALNLLGDYEDSRDLSQDVFLQVFRTLDRFRGQSSLRTWIYRIAVNLARNRHRWWRRRRRSDQVSIDEHIQQHGELAETTGAAEPDRVLGRKQVAERVWQALDDLPFDQRTAMVLREIDGLSYDEIAFSLGVAVGTVKSRLTRAREALRVAVSGARARPPRSSRLARPCAVVRPAWPPCGISTSKACSPRSSAV